MTRLLLPLLAGLGLAFLAAPLSLAQEAETSTPIDPAAEPPRCVRLVNISGYSVIDNQHVVLRGGVARHYLLTLRRSCPGVRFGAQIATTFGRNERVCRPVIESVINSDGFRCAIDQVEEVEDLDAAQALIEARAQLAAEANASD